MYTTFTNRYYLIPYKFDSIQRCKLQICNNKLVARKEIVHLLLHICYNYIVIHFECIENRTNVNNNIYLGVGRYSKYVYRDAKMSSTLDRQIRSEYVKVATKKHLSLEPVPRSRLIYVLYLYNTIFCYETNELVCWSLKVPVAISIQYTINIFPHYITT